ncbi:GNAT family N-acetyltransferase [Arthrobacter sp. AOP36-A1-22]|uniref:GNAT family N-acetyltransferase n=1 Tax=Arthrobacter sp. AOP36-A1-22 TaxID=3457684 RepID=UPI004033B067
MALRIRPATPADAASIEALENDADRLLIDWLSPAHWPPAPSGASRLSADGYLLVAEEGIPPAILGFVHVLEVEGLAHLEQLSVAPAHGRQGYGLLLLNAALAEARVHGYDRVSLRTYADVPWNAPFYSRAGFVEVLPATDFHRGLIDTEEDLGLPGYGRRVQMTASLNDRTVGP